MAGCTERRQLGEMVGRYWGLGKMHRNVRTTVLAMTDELRDERMSRIVYRSQKLSAQPVREVNELV